MAQTLQDQLSRGCLNYGMTELKKTAKYRRFHSPKTNCDFFVGRAGAFRVSRTRKATETMVVTEGFRLIIMGLGSYTVTDPAKLGF